MIQLHVTHCWRFLLTYPERKGWLVCAGWKKSNHDEFRYGSNGNPTLLPAQFPQDVKCASNHPGYKPRSPWPARFELTPESIGSDGKPKFSPTNIICHRSYGWSLLVVGNAGPTHIDLWLPSIEVTCPRVFLTNLWSHTVTFAIESGASTWFTWRSHLPRALSRLVPLQTLTIMITTHQPQRKRPVSVHSQTASQPLQSQHYGCAEYTTCIWGLCKGLKARDRDLGAGIAVGSPCSVRLHDNIELKKQEITGPYYQACVFNSSTRIAHPPYSLLQICGRCCLVPGIRMNGPNMRNITALHLMAASNMSARPQSPDANFNINEICATRYYSLNRGGQEKTRYKSSDLWNLGAQATTSRSPKHSIPRTQRSQERQSAEGAQEHEEELEAIQEQRRHGKKPSIPKKRLPKRIIAPISLAC